MTYYVRQALEMLFQARGLGYPDFETYFPGVAGSTARSGRAFKPSRHPQPETDFVTEWEAEVRRVAEAHGGLMPLTEESTPPDGWCNVRLSEEAGPPPAPRADDETEAAIAGTIGDLRVLMRDVAVQSARLSCGTEDRLRFIEGACKVARTSAKLSI